jgi:hypothetical protein
MEILPRGGVFLSCSSRGWRRLRLTQSFYTHHMHYLPHCLAASERLSVSVQGPHADIETKWGVSIADSTLSRNRKDERWRDIFPFSEPSSAGAATSLPPPPSKSRQWELNTRDAGMAPTDELTSICFCAATVFNHLIFSSKNDFRDFSWIFSRTVSAMRKFRTRWGFMLLNTSFDILQLQDVGQDLHCALSCIQCIV